jgi:heat shock protein HspQ
VSPKEEADRLGIPLEEYLDYVQDMQDMPIEEPTLEDLQDARSTTLFRPKFNPETL